MDSQNPPQNPVEPASSAPVEDVRTQIASHILAGKNVLVTVKANPSVDELASALGLTFLLGVLDKHATAVFSGKIPSAVEFLDPEKVFEGSVDSLRDFIIALDKEKADKLRYKVEDDVVKVFITPYRTVITEKDLSFSQGDYNVDVVVALGATQKDQLDKAILAHGKILHDATVVTLTAGPSASQVGSLNWNEPDVSSVAEMIVSLGEALNTQLDAQISTALLTGVVAETNRFSNEKTSPKVMNIAAQLMAAGANQQLIATNLRQEGMISQPIRAQKGGQPSDDNGEVVLDHDSPGKNNKGNRKNSSKTNNEVQKSPPKAQKVSKNTAGTPDNQSISADNALKSSPSEGSDLAQEDQKDGPGQSDSATALKETLAAASPAVDVTDKVEPASTSAVAEPMEPHHKVIQPLASSEQPPVADTFSNAPPEPIVAEPQALGPAADSSNRAAPADVPPSFNSEPGSPESPDDSVEDARRAVEMASEAEPTPGTTQVTSVEPVPASTADTLPSVTFDQESPIDAFMKVQDTPNTPVDGFTVPAEPMPMPQPTFSAPSAPAASPSASDLPPLPPLPGDAAANGFPPMPPLPGNDLLSAPNMQAQMQPDFMQGVATSQNAWTQAGSELAAKRAEKEAAYQDKMQQRSEGYDQAAERQEELRKQAEEKAKVEQEPNQPAA